MVDSGCAGNVKEIELKNLSEEDEGDQKMPWLRSSYLMADGHGERWRSQLKLRSEAAVAVRLTTLADTPHQRKCGACTLVLRCRRFIFDHAPFNRTYTFRNKQHIVRSYCQIVRPIIIKTTATSQ